MHFVTDRPTDKYSYNRWSLIRGIFTKNNYTSILNSNLEIDVSVFLHFCLCTDRQSDRQTFFYRIDAHIQEECAHKNINEIIMFKDYLNKKLNLIDIRPQTP